MAFVIPKEGDSLEDRDVAHSQEEGGMALVDSQIGNFGRPAHVWFVSQLPKTRSGKMLRRAIQAILRRTRSWDLTTIDDPASLDPDPPGDGRVRYCRMRRVAHPTPCADA